MKLLYCVVRSFAARSAISGRERQFMPEETFSVDSGQTGASLLINADEFLFAVDRTTFQNCCVFQGEVAVWMSISSMAAAWR
jgi:hypothetical protein